MKRIKLTIAVIAALVWCGSATFSKAPKDIRIGATQIVEHPALDASRKGFETALKDKGFGEAKIEFRNAQGDFSTAQLIAQSFVDDKKDLIFTISTPSSQAALNATKDIPIVITAVTDPVKSGLTSKNLTGTSDPMPIADQVALIKEALPAVKTVGLIYNTSEANSAASIAEIKRELEKAGLKYEEAGVTSVNDIVPALTALLGKTDALYLTTDNLISSAATLVVELSTKANKPVVAAEESHMQFGALMTKTIDFYQIGYRAGEMAAEILQGKAVSDIPIEAPKENRVMVNRKMAAKFKVDLNNPVFKTAEIVE